MGSFIIGENTRIYSTRQYKADSIGDRIGDFLKENKGCEILDWSQTGDGDGWVFITIFYNLPNQELDDILK